MTARSLFLPILGLTMLTHPALASVSFFTGTTANTDYNNAVIAAGLPSSGLYTFSGANLSGDNLEYADPASLVNFFAFTNLNSSNPGSANTLSVNSAAL